MSKKAPRINYSECKYCGNSLVEATPIAQVVGVCSYCEDALFATKTKKKKKPTYNLG